MREMFSLMAIGLAAASLITTSSAAGRTPTERSRACSAQATEKKLAGPARTRFRQSCAAGPLAAATPTRPIAGGRAEKAITQPSGQDRDQRSRACAGEADRKSGGDDNRRKSIFMSCLASAAPASATGTPTQAPTPTHELPKLGATPPH
jgi:hypothetical protein